MSFCELSNAAFRFSLRRPGAEIMGGGGRSNAPQQAVENPEAQQGAGVPLGPSESFYVRESPSRS